MTLQLALLPDKILEVGFGSLNNGPFLPTTLDKSIQYLPVQEEGGLVIASQDFFSAETANSLTQLRSGGYGWQSGAAELINEATGIAPEFFFQVGAWHFL